MKIEEPPMDADKAGIDAGGASIKSFTANEKKSASIGGSLFDFVILEFEYDVN